jgi:hypothetical protein
MLGLNPLQSNMPLGSAPVLSPRQNSSRNKNKGGGDLLISLRKRSITVKLKKSNMYIQPYGGPDPRCPSNFCMYDVLIRSRACLSHDITGDG